ncbi:hypothetical protein SLS57_002242 [Botryosphaeria dothidea]
MSDSSLSSEPPDLTSETTISTSPSGVPHTPNSTPKQTPYHSFSSGGSFDPNSSADRLLARTAGMRIDTPTPYPRLLLEPHITVRLDHTLDPEEADRTATTLQSRYPTTVLIRHSPEPSPDSTARRLAARKHRKAHPITRAANEPDAFLASIAQPPPGTVALPPSFLATAKRALSQAEVTPLFDATSPPPLFVYGHWQFPAQLAGALGAGPAPSAAAIKHWTQRMVPATLGGWNRYCVRGAAPTAAVLPHGCARLRYYIRDVVEQEGVEGRLVLGLSAEQHARLDGLLEVGLQDMGVATEEKVWGKREVLVGTRVAGSEGMMSVKAVAYVWEGDPLDLHIFKQDKVWTPELYVDWHCRARRQRSDGDDKGTSG